MNDDHQQEPRHAQIVREAIALRIGRERPEVQAAASRDQDKCVACGFDLRCALAVHHRLPKELGGKDTISNLTTLCSNCHKAVHWLSGEGRLAGKEGDQARRIYSPTAFAKLTELAEVIQAHRARTKLAGNRWLKEADTEGQMSLAAALRLVARRNHFEGARTSVLEQVVQRVLVNLSAAALKGCSIRLVQRGRFFSVNAKNILLFRVPGVFDGVKDPDGDVLLLWPERTRLSVLSKDEWREIQKGEGRFAAVPCFNLPLDFEQVLKMTTADWSTFSRACDDAIRLGKGREWVSNVDLAEPLARMTLGPTRHAADSARNRGRAAADA